MDTACARETKQVVVEKELDNLGSAINAFEDLLVVLGNVAAGRTEKPLSKEPCVLQRIPLSVFLSELPNRLESLRIRITDGTERLKNLLL